MIGASSHSRWREFFRGSVVHGVIRESGPIDVHVISQDTPSSGESLAAAPTPGLTWNRRVAGYLVGAAGLVLLTVALTAAREQLSLSSIMLLYLTLVVGVAAIGGLWPAVASALASGLVINWYFTEPIHTWTIAEAENVLAIVVFVFVASVVSVLVDRAARSRTEAQRGRAEAEALARLSGWLAAEDDRCRRSWVGSATRSVCRPCGAPPGGEGLGARGFVGPAPIEPSEGSDAIELSDGAVLVLQGVACRRSRAACSPHSPPTGRSRSGPATQRGGRRGCGLVEVDELRTAILRRSPTTCGRRWPRSRRRSPACSSADVDWTPSDTEEFLARSTKSPTDSRRWSGTCST